jgi:hypothetical protein
LEDPGIEERTILKKKTFYKWDGRKDWIGLDQDMDTWLAVVNAVMSFHVP